MKKLFSTKIRIIAAAAIAFAVIAGLVAAALLGRAGPVKNAVSFIVTPVRTGVTAVANKIEQVYDYMYKYDALVTENELLRQQLAEMEREVRDATEIAKENDSLRELIGLKERHSEYELVSASVVSYGSSNWVNTLTVGKGSSSGIDVNMCVISSTGDVIGIVTEVFTTSATVATIVDTGTEIGATVIRSGEIGLAEGDFSLMKQGLLRVNYLSHDAELRNGDEVLTTGGGLYPKGLLIGHITDVSTDESGINKIAVMRPAADLSALSRVYVVTDFTDIE